MVKQLLLPFRALLVATQKLQHAQKQQHTHIDIHRRCVQENLALGDLQLKTKPKHIQTQQVVEAQIRQEPEGPPPGWAAAPASKKRRTKEAEEILNP